MDDIDRNGDVFDVKPNDGDNIFLFSIAKFMWILIH